jgi:hypothetical protein
MFHPASVLPAVRLHGRPFPPAANQFANLFSGQGTKTPLPCRLSSKPSHKAFENDRQWLN